MAASGYCVAFVHPQLVNSAGWCLNSRLEEPVGGVMSVNGVLPSAP